MSTTHYIPYIKNKNYGEVKGLTKAEPGADYTYKEVLGLKETSVSEKGLIETTTNSGKVGSDKLNIDSDLDKIVDHINKTVYLANDDNNTIYKAFQQASTKYNRFKTADPNTVLMKGFPHVFFVRPSCNIVESGGGSLVTALQGNELFNYAWQSAPWLCRALSIDNGQSHDFLLSLSNYAASFSNSDEYINADTYGKTWTGYKVAYGKNDIESKTAGSFSVTFKDDRNLHIYQLHRLWVEYINGCYRGEITPKNTTILNKILDYTGALYYIITAEDGETIIFWTKYYGIFPTDIPSSQYSWGSGNLISSPELDIKYQYSFKEDFNPYSLIEFNKNAGITGATSYLPIYDEDLGTTGMNWVGAPFIDLEKDTNTQEYVYKLRFKKP
jgi:hypothetical protein